MAKIRKGKSVSLPAGIGIGVGTSLLASVTAVAVLAALVNAEKLNIGSITVVTALVHLISSFLGGWLATLLTKQKRLVTALSTAAGYLLVMIGMTALIFDGQYQGIGLALLMVFIGSGAVILLGMRGNKGRIRKHKISAYR